MWIGAYAATPTTKLPMQPLLSRDEGREEGRKERAREGGREGGGEIGTCVLTTCACTDTHTRHAYTHIHTTTGKRPCRTATTRGSASSSKSSWLPTGSSWMWRGLTPVACTIHPWSRPPGWRPDWSSSWSSTGRTSPSTVTQRTVPRVSSASRGNGLVLQQPTSCTIAPCPGPAWLSSTSLAT